MRVLVAYGSKMGGTRGLAEMIGEELENNGFSVDVVDARAATDVDGYDAVVLGGALYTARWHKRARRFVRRHRHVLETKPVWLFSSGPLDGTALEGDIPPVRFVRNAMVQLGARGHTTFGGRLQEEAKGFPASSMAKTGAGDWRDPDQARGWAKLIAEELQAA
jgi:menaquinone-dependent protoporphyrinogen oxidase